MAKKKTVKSITSDAFPMSFVGEYVELLGSFTNIGRDGAVGLVQGYLLDFDESFYFLGAHPDEVSAAIRIDSTDVIQIVKVKDPYEEMLDNAKASNNGFN